MCKNIENLNVVTINFSLSDDCPLSSDSSRFNGILNGSVPLVKNAATNSTSSKTTNVVVGSSSTTSSIPSPKISHSSKTQSNTLIH